MGRSDSRAFTNKGRPVAVIGSGNCAVEEAAFLTTFSPKVTLLVRSAKLSANKIAVDKAIDMLRPVRFSFWTHVS